MLILSYGEALKNPIAAKPLEANGEAAGIYKRKYVLYAYMNPFSISKEREGCIKAGEGRRGNFYLPPSTLNCSTHVSRGTFGINVIPDFGKLLNGYAGSQGGGIVFNWKTSRIS